MIIAKGKLARNARKFSGLALVKRVLRRSNVWGGDERLQ